MGSTRRDSGGRIVRVSAVTIHPMYGQPQFDHDIAALRLSQPLVFGPAIQPIRLPNPRQAVPLVRLTVTGWGLTAVSILIILLYLKIIKLPKVKNVEQIVVSVVINGLFFFLAS